MAKMLTDSQFRRSPNCSKFSLLVNEKDPQISDYVNPKVVSGKDLTEEYFNINGFDYPLLIKDAKEALDLKVPLNVKSLADIARIIGPDFQVKVSQLESLGGLTVLTIARLSMLVHNMKLKAGQLVTMLSESRPHSALLCCG
jgi:hypothetical protein